MRLEMMMADGLELPIPLYGGLQLQRGLRYLMCPYDRSRTCPFPIPRSSALPLLIVHTMGPLYLVRLLNYIMYSDPILLHRHSRSAILYIPIGSSRTSSSHCLGCLLAFIPFVPRAPLSSLYSLPVDRNSVHSAPLARTPAEQRRRSVTAALLPSHELE